VGYLTRDAYADEERLMVFRAVFLSALNPKWLIVSRTLAIFQYLFASCLADLSKVDTLEIFMC